jgi:DNA invertase Pin-like site-specific DNA recombinase
MINIGERIKKELLLQERSVTWFAKKLGCTRMSVYRIFEKQSIDTQQLIQISKILERDFFNEISEELNIACNNSETEL